MRYVWLLLATLAVGCGSDSPTAPSGPPSVAGVWSGGWTRQTCTETIVGSCALFFQSLNNGGPVRLTLNQSGASLSGTAEFGNLITTVSGQVTTSGIVALTGRGTFQNAATITVTNWSTSAFISTMSGTFTLGILGADLNSITIGATTQLTKN